MKGLRCVQSGNHHSTTQSHSSMSTSNLQHSQCKSESPILSTVAGKGNVPCASADCRSDSTSFTSIGVRTCWLLIRPSSVCLLTCWSELTDPGLEGTPQVGCTTNLCSIPPHHHGEMSSVCCKPWPHEAVELDLQAEDLMKAVPINKMIIKLASSMLRQP